MDSNSSLLERLRGRIDDCDRELLKLFNERASIALEIGQLKELLDLPIEIREREKEVLRRVSEGAGLLPKDAVRRIFQAIMDETKLLEWSAAEENNRSSDRKGRSQG